jgi:hypothetical protein
MKCIHGIDLSKPCRDCPNTDIDPRWRIAWTQYQIQVRDWKGRLPARNCNGGLRRWDKLAEDIWNSFAKCDGLYAAGVLHKSARELHLAMFAHDRSA